MSGILGVIAEQLEGVGIPYEFMRWTGDAKYPYFVGEYSEAPTGTEDGSTQATLMLTGFTRGSWLELEENRARVEALFPPAGGFRTATDSGSAAVFYSGSFPVQTGDAELKRIQINLEIHEWRNI